MVERAYRLAAHVGMPHGGHELHLGGLEGVVLGDGDVDLKGAALVRRVGGPGEAADEGAEVSLVGGPCEDAGRGAVGLQLLELLDDAAVAVARHRRGVVVQR